MNHTGISILSLAALLLVTASGCSGVPDGVIQPDDMAGLLVDIHIGEAVAEQNRSSFPNDSSRQVLKQSVYARHGVSSDEVDSSLMWYGRHIDKYADIYAEVEKILESKIAEANELAATSDSHAPVQAFIAEGDSVDIWPAYRSRFLNPNLSTDRIAFNIKSDRFWEKGDIYWLRFKAVNAPDDFEATIAAEYSDGRIDYASSGFRGDGWHDLYLHMADSLTASSLYGAIVYRGEEQLPGSRVEARVDSLSLVRMRISNGDRLPRSGQRRFGPIRP